MPVMAIRQHIAAAIDIVVHLGRLRDNSRRVLEICEITGVEGGEIKMQTIFKFREDREEQGRVKGVLVQTAELKNIQKLLQSGWRNKEDEEKERKGEKQKKAI